MKKLIFLILTLGILLTGCDRCEREDFKPEKYYTIEGRMINSETGEPIKNMALRLKGYDDYGHPKWAVDRDTTDENGNFSLRYRYKDVGVELKSYVIYEKEGHLGLPIEIIELSDTISIKKDFCLYPKAYVKLKILNFSHLAESDTIYILLPYGSSLTGYDVKNKITISKENEDVQKLDGLVLTKQMMISNGTFQFTLNSEKYFFPENYFNKFVCYYSNNTDSIKHFLNYPSYEYGELNISNLSYYEISECQGTYEINLDISNIPK